MAPVEHELEQWTFPQLHTEEDSMKMNIQQEINILESEIASKQTEIETIQETYQEKIHILDNIIKNFQKLNPIFIKELTDIFYALIKQISLRVIKSELTQNPQLIQTMIENILSSISPEVGEPNIYLSATDHAQLMNHSNETLPFTLYIDPKIQQGDIIIKTKSSEFWAKLDSRIDLILGNTQHD